FMPLDSIRPKKVKTGDNLEQEPGFCGYGLDCVSFEEKYRPAMEFLLGNVVVTQDMDAAVKLYKKLDGGFKIVTLEGEIISDRGTITGGKYKNKSANILERRAEIAALEETLADKITKQKSVEARRKELQETLETMQEAISNTDEEILAKEKGIFAEENEINRIKTARTEAGNKEEKWQRELEQIDIEQETSQQSKEALSDEVWAMENEIRLVERQTMENTTAYSDKKREVDALYEEITKERIAVSGCESEKAKIDAVVEKVNEAIAGFEKDKAEKERQLETQKEEKEKLVFGAGETTAIIKENQEKKALLDAQLEALYQEKTQLIQRIEGVAQKKEETDKITASFQNQKYELEVRSAKQETQLENAKAKLWEEFEVSYLQALEFKLEEFDFQQAVRKSRELKARLRDLGEVNIGAIKEFETVGERYSFLTAQREDIFVSMKELQGIIGDMDKVIRIKFKESFEQVVENFEAVFQDLYGGGHAKITFSNEENPFESEIEITAQPPGKQLKHINLMSGGEKTMTAIALMFAVLKTKPTPCCILDEIEAALDDSNLEIFGKYVERFAGVQFTLITHQKSTMEHADVMYGVTMPESGISKVYSLKMGEQPVM
ncbi:MAG: hypothetical protein RR626_05390, partial [Anaerovoracaceae bacterium]